MCLIVDASAAGEFLAKPNTVVDWLLGRDGNPRLVAAGKLKQELELAGRVPLRLLVQLDRAGRLRSADADELEREEDRLRAENCCRSNDRHVLALAIVSGARTLATFDRALAGVYKISASFGASRSCGMLCR